MSCLDSCGGGYMRVSVLLLGAAEHLVLSCRPGWGRAPSGEGMSGGCTEHEPDMAEAQR